MQQSLSGYQNDGIELMDTQRELVETMQEAALRRMEERPLAGVAELRLADYFEELFVLRQLRDRAIECGDREQAVVYTDREEDLLRDLKRMGVPYHPAFGNRDDWRRLDASDPGKRDYDWSRGDRG
jgi:hypothetical protein